MATEDTSRLIEQLARFLANAADDGGYSRTETLLILRVSKLLLEAEQRSTPPSSGPYDDLRILTDISDEH